ncbi:MAG: PAS domain-containing protein [Bauldia sp.]
MRSTPRDLLDFRAIFEQGPDLLLLLAPDLTIVGVSDAYARATMTARQEIVGRGLFEVFPGNPDDPTASGVDNLQISLDRVLKLRLPDAMALQKYDIRRPLAQGGGFEERYWSPLNTPVLDDKGEVALIIHRVEDVTEFVRLKEKDEARDELIRERQAMVDQLRRANDDLARTRRFVDLVVENIPAMVFVKDAAEHRFLLVNLAGEQLLGIGRSELLGKNDHDFFPKEQADHFVARDNEVFRMGVLQDTPEEEITTRHNGVRLLHTQKLPVFDENGRPQYLVALVEDITERRNMEDQLAQSQKMEAIGNLTGGMAHDFNNLLGVVIGNLDLLRGRRNADAEADELVGEALDAALRGADLTRRLLAFARRQPLRPQRIAANELVASISKLLARTLGENIEINLDLGADIWPVVADSSQLEAALVNIATNARDAMPQGGMLMIATGNRRLDEDYTGLHPGLSPGDYAMIEMSDTGAGMSPAVASRIFEPFFTTKEQGKGTGLGLSMVFGFMKQSGGHINVYSEVGVGTTFRLFLPRDLAGGDVAALPASPVVERGGNETVLAVEDNAGLRRVVARQLKELGYRLFEAEDGPSALKILESQPVDLLLTDVVMPGGMSGYDLARTAMLRWPMTKIVLTSGFPDVKPGNGGPSAGMSLLTKPYRKDELARVLREALDA